MQAEGRHQKRCTVCLTVPRSRASRRRGARWPAGAPPAPAPAPAAAADDDEGARAEEAFFDPSSSREKGRLRVRDARDFVPSTMRRVAVASGVVALVGERIADIGDGGPQQVITVLFDRARYSEVRARGARARPRVGSPSLSARANTPFTHTDDATRSQAKARAWWLQNSERLVGNDPEI